MKFETELTNILFSVLKDMPKGEPEFKIFKENEDRIFEYYLERFDFIAEEFHFHVFSKISDQLDDFSALLSKQLYEICDLSQFFCQTMRKLNPLFVLEEVESDKNKNIFLLAVETLANIGNRLLNMDP